MVVWGGATQQHVEQCSEGPIVVWCIQGQLQAIKVWHNGSKRWNCGKTICHLVTWVFVVIKRPTETAPWVQCMCSDRTHMTDNNVANDFSSIMLEKTPVLRYILCQITMVLRGFNKMLDDLCWFLICRKAHSVVVEKKFPRIHPTQIRMFHWPKEKTIFPVCGLWNRMGHDGLKMKKMAGSCLKFKKKKFVRTKICWKNEWMIGWKKFRKQKLIKHFVWLSCKLGTDWYEMWCQKTVPRTDGTEQKKIGAVVSQHLWQCFLTLCNSFPHCLCDAYLFGTKYQHTVNDRCKVATWMNDSSVSSTRDKSTRSENRWVGGFHVR